MKSHLIVAGLAFAAGWIIATVVANRRWADKTMARAKVNTPALGVDAIERIRAKVDVQLYDHENVVIGNFSSYRDPRDDHPSNRSWRPPAS